MLSSNQSINMCIVLLYSALLVCFFIRAHFVVAQQENAKCSSLNRLWEITLFNTNGLSNLLILSIPDEGYSRNAPCALNLISTFSSVHKNCLAKMNMQNFINMRISFYSHCNRRRHDCDRLVVGLTTTREISAYHH